MARPTKPEDERRNNVRQSAFTNKEAARIEAISRAKEQSISDFIREAVMFYIDHKLGRTDK